MPVSYTLLSGNAILAMVAFLVLFEAIKQVRKHLQH